MTALIHLWLPILLSAVVVFTISSLVHMVFKWHASDYKPVANEDALRATVNAANLTPGLYVVPFCKDMKDMGSPEVMKKYQEGPVLHVTVMPKGLPNMGKYLGLWFAWSLVIATLAAYLAARAGGPGAAAASAARWAASITFIGHGFGTVTESIWMGRPWSTSAKYLLDSALYAAGTWAVFLWLWP